MAPIANVGSFSQQEGLGQVGQCSLDLHAFACCVIEQLAGLDSLNADRMMVRKVCLLVNGVQPSDSDEGLSAALEGAADRICHIVEDLKTSKADPSIFDVGYALITQKNHATHVLYDALREKGFIVQEERPDIVAKRAAINAVDITQVTELNMSGKGLKCIPEELVRFAALQRLYLASNKLEQLPSGIFNNLTMLRYLDLGSNQLGCLPDGIFDRLEQLRELELGSNRFVRLSSELFSQLGNLDWVYLGENERLWEGPSVLARLGVFYDREDFMRAFDAFYL